MTPSTQKVSTAVVSAPPVGTPLTDTERKLRFAELRARLGTSRTAVIAPPGWHPYWARKEDEEELSRLDALGFKRVVEVKGSPKRYRAAGFKEDGTYTVGDVILMEIEEDAWQFYEQEYLDRAASMVPSAKEGFRAKAAEVGAPTFDQDDKKSNVR